MAKRKGNQRESICEEDVQGLKYFRKLWPLFERLHEVGCGRDKAGNRELFMDQYCARLLDVPAEIIAEIYRQRWTIELFFRFFKHVLGCRHLLSTARRGVEIQTYCAIIACLLLALWTGGKPTLRTFEMVCLYFQGWADQDELLAHLKKLKPHIA